jgi:hypothetical protein
MVRGVSNPIIPSRVPLPAPIGSGPKVQISKHALIKKDMRDGRQTVEGGQNRVPHVHGARPVPAPTEGGGVGVPGMIKVRMDGLRSRVIDQPTIAGSATTHAQQAVGRPMPQRRQPFTLEGATLCRALLTQHIETMTAARAELEEGSLEIKQADAIMVISTQTAEDLDAIIGALTPRAAPAPRAPTPRPSVPVRAVVTGPRPQINGIAPRPSGGPAQARSIAPKAPPAPVIEAVEPELDQDADFDDAPNG